ncbi:hypothetical protein SAMN05443572_10536 [Myxococcus fulvus]|uniref:Uncharacterized protein n=2 Tax=Myxococcus fulvus TaxID=33 RepID=A0A511TDX0_MYXFU|nr:hypothetical protein MFU01_66390 [Myxococcus fulvus]SEU11447.1 hypothetical protein SAMN05443572_10536 [Myxococcus fulvus]
MLMAPSRLVSTALVVALGLPVTAVAADPVATLDAPVRAPQPLLHGHRYAFVAGGVLAVGGLGLGFFAQGEAKRAQSLSSAREARSTLDRARSASTAANLMYAAAGAAVLYGLVLELLPDEAADTASLTYHF